MASVAKREWEYNGVKKSAWVVRYYDENGSRKSKQFEKQKDGLAFKRKVEREMEDGTHVNRVDALTVSKICKDYLVQAEARLADGRIGINRFISLRNTLNNRITPHLGPIKMVDLTAERVEKFYQDMQTKDKLGVRTAKDTIYDLRLVEGFALKRGYTKKTPIVDALKELRGTAPSRVRTFHAEQVSHLLDVVSSRAFRFKARTAAMLECMVNIAAFCGLRYGEIMALDISAIDLEKRMFRIRHSLLFNDELKGPKTAAGNRDVPMPRRVVELLLQWMEKHYVVNERNLIFRTPKGTIVRQANFHRSWIYLLERAGLREGEAFHFHALRHFCASWMIENGLPLTDVAALLGHSKFDMTLQVYAHPVVRPSLRHEAIERMTSALPIRPLVLDDARVTQGA